MNVLPAKQPPNWVFTPGAPGAGTLVIDSEHGVEEYAEIRNITKNSVLYSIPNPFTAPTPNRIQATVGTGSTQINFAVDTSAMDATDVIQVLVYPTS